MRYNYKKLGEILKEEREKQEYSRRNLAARCDISDTELKRIEDGERIAPNLITLIKLCEELELNIQFLLEDTNFLEVKDDKTFFVLVRNAELSLFRIQAKNNYDAVRFILTFLIDNPIIEIDKELPTIDFYVTENRKDIEERIEESDLNFIDYTLDDTCFECPYCGETISEDDLD